MTPKIPTGPAKLEYTERRAEGPPNGEYRVYQDGRVVCWGEELRINWRDRFTPTYIASAWSKHPLDNEDAVHLGHLAADSSFKDLQTALKAWEKTGELP